MSTNPFQLTNPSTFLRRVLQANGIFSGVSSVAFVLVMDIAWVIGSAVLLLAQWVPFTSAGWSAVAAVAEIVALFVVLQIVGLWHMRRGVAR